MDESGVATELGCGALSPGGEGKRSEETACRPRSVPSAEVVRGATGTANTEAARESLAHAASGKTQLGPCEAM